MTTKSFFPLLLASAALFVSCKKELQPQDSSDTKPAAAPTAVTPVATSAPQQVQPQIVQAPASTPPAQTQKTAPGMNPPHGQPNHRCDIAVGAPPNSPPGQKAATPVPQGKASVQPTVRTVSQPAVVTETAPGMNPPHGQPGHSCAVAVGAPLPKT